MNSDQITPVATKMYEVLLREEFEKHATDLDLFGGTEVGVEARRQLRQDRVGEMIAQSILNVQRVRAHRERNRLLLGEDLPTVDLDSKEVALRYQLLRFVALDARQTIEKLKAGVALQEG